MSFITKNQIKNAGKIKVQKESENKVELNVEVKNETETAYQCLLTFISNDEDDKIKSIEYPEEKGKEPYTLYNNGDKKKIAMDYKIEKENIEKTFKVTTESGNVVDLKTNYIIQYNDNNGRILKEINLLKGSKEKIIEQPNLAPEITGKHFLGWSENKDAAVPDYYEDGKYICSNKNSTLYAIWTDEQSGKKDTIENEGLIGKISKINTSGVQTINVNGEVYSANVIVEDKDVVLDGQKIIEGAELKDNIYEFGNKNQDVATENEYAKNMVILKVNGNLTINYNVAVTACKSDNGYGGPKGLLIYCTGTLTNNGTIDMTARGAKAEGQNVYLWQNADNSYEYVPAVGASGGASITWNSNGYTGQNGKNRELGGGGSGGLYVNKRGARNGAGGSATSYSGGAGRRWNRRILYNCSYRRGWI